MNNVDFRGNSDHKNQWSATLLLDIGLGAKKAKSYIDLPKLITLIQEELEKHGD